ACTGCTQSARPLGLGPCTGILSDASRAHARTPARTGREDHRHSGLSAHLARGGEDPRQCPAYRRRRPGEFLLSRANVRFGEITADIKQRRVKRLRRRISETVAEIEPCRMSSFPKYEKC